MEKILTFTESVMQLSYPNYVSRFSIIGTASEREICFPCEIIE